jgi:hypothetical protein
MALSHAALVPAAQRREREGGARRALLAVSAAKKSQEASLESLLLFLLLLFLILFPSSSSFSFPPRRIHPEFYPVQVPCNGNIDNLGRPFVQVPAVFDGFLGFKNGMKGAIATQVRASLLPPL